MVIYCERRHSCHIKTLKNKVLRFHFPFKKCSLFKTGLTPKLRKNRYHRASPFASARTRLLRESGVQKPVMWRGGSHVWCEGLI